MKNKILIAVDESENAIPKAFFSGSVSGKIFHHAKNCAVWVVE